MYSTALNGQSCRHDRMHVRSSGGGKEGPYQQGRQDRRAARVRMAMCNANGEQPYVDAIAPRIEQVAVEKAECHIVQMGARPTVG